MSKKTNRIRATSGREEHKVRWKTYTAIQVANILQLVSVSSSQSPNIF
ncbi:hypothetical protein [Nostoc sp. NZL]|nr:hypothetical protein [Nostoc sp. NZL]